MGFFLSMRTPTMPFVSLDDVHLELLGAAGDADVDVDVGEGLCVPNDSLDSIVSYVSAQDEGFLKSLGYCSRRSPAMRSYGERKSVSGDDRDDGDESSCETMMVGEGVAPKCAMNTPAGRPTHERAPTTVPESGLDSNMPMDSANLATVPTMPTGSALETMPTGGAMMNCALPMPSGGLTSKSAALKVPAGSLIPKSVPPTMPTPPLTMPAAPPPNSGTTTATSSGSLSSTSSESAPLPAHVLAFRFTAKSVPTKRRRPRTAGHKRHWSLQLPLLLPAILDSGNKGKHGNDDNDDEYNCSSHGVLQARHRQRRCGHCGTVDTPQWRAGPYGPGTLCNACGIRFKMNRLLPEYRPSTSPSFTRSQHSNRHKNVLKIREKKVVVKETAPATTASTDVVHVYIS